jgi:hypothetical protein
MIVVGVGGVFCGALAWRSYHFSRSPIGPVLAGSFFRLLRPLRFAAIAGMCVDFALGIHLHFTLQNHVFAVRPHVGGLTFENAPGLSTLCLMNWYDKDFHDYVFLGDHLTAMAPLIRLVMAALFIGWALWAARMPFEQPVSQRRTTR